MKKVVIITLVVAFAVASCKKYPDGPDISFRSKAERLSNTWVIDQYFENGVNKTTDFKNLAKDYVMAIDKGGSYSLSYKVLGIIPYSESGTWAFNGDKTKVVFTRTSPAPVNTSDWTILKLKENELWGQYNDSTKVIKVQLIPQ